MLHARTRCGECTIFGLIWSEERTILGPGTEKSTMLGLRAEKRIMLSLGAEKWTVLGLIISQNALSVLNIDNSTRGLEIKHANDTKEILQVCYLGSLPVTCDTVNSQNQNLTEQRNLYKVKKRDIRE